MYKYKERHWFVTVCLILIIIDNFIDVLFNIFEMDIGLDRDPIIFLGIIGVINIIFIVLIFCWKIQGFIGLIAAKIIEIIIVLLAAIDGAYISVFGYFNYTSNPVIFILGLILQNIIVFSIFFAILNIKKLGISTWDYLKEISPDKNKTNADTSKQEALNANLVKIDNSITFKKCRACGEKVDENIFKCPNCKGDAFV